MKTFFSPCSTDDVAEFGDSGTFVSNGVHYFNFVEYGTNPGGLEEVAIVDGCGRYVPVCIDDLPDLIAALTDAYRMAQELVLADKLVAYALSDAAQHVENTYVQLDPKSIQAMA